MTEPVPTICWDDADSGQDPRRREARITVERQIALIILDAFDRPVKRLRTPTINITRGGVGLLCDQPLAIGGHVIVLLRTPGAPASSAMKMAGGIVRFCSSKPVDQRYHRIGIEFVPRDAMTNAFANLESWRLTA
jgi:hypothetical protein